METNPKYRYQAYCQVCHYKKLINDENIKELDIKKSVDFQSGIPKLNPLTKKIETPQHKKGKSKIKCPKCSRIIFITRYYDTTEEDNPT